MTKIKLKQHQIIPVEYMKNHRALLLYHSTGSGKTIIALKAMCQFKNDIIIVCPKSGRKAFNDDIKKLGMDYSRITIYTYQKIKLILESSLDAFENKSVILDEAHYIRNETTNNLTLITALTFAHKIILMTATPVINYPNDIAPLVNIVKNAEVLPTDQAIFNNMYYDDEAVKIMNTDVLRTKLANSLSYHKTTNSKSFPTKNIIYKEVEMNKEQIDEYAKYMKRYLYDDTVVINKTNTELYAVDFATFNKRKRNFFLNATRQLSNTIKGNPNFPKIREIYDTLISGNFPAIVYSNFLKNGVYCISSLLEKNGYTYKIITGNTNVAKLNYIVNKYNNGELQVLLMSSAGSESLDLKNTRQVHIMEPHWNEAKITQVIGRAARYKSHVTLPEDDRNIIIYRWISTFPKPIVNISADRYLIDLSKKKESMFALYDDIIKEASIEQNWYVQKGGNQIMSSKYKTNKHKYKMLYNMLL